MDGLVLNPILLTLQLMGMLNTAFLNMLLATAIV